MVWMVTFTSGGGATGGDGGNNAGGDGVGGAAGGVDGGGHGGDGGGTAGGGGGVGGVGDVGGDGGWLHRPQCRRHPAATPLSTQWGMMVNSAHCSAVKATPVSAVPPVLAQGGGALGGGDGDVDGGGALGGGDGDVDGGGALGGDVGGGEPGGGALGGGGGGEGPRSRIPQSAQSEPNAHTDATEFSPPSSQMPLF